MAKQIECLINLDGDVEINVLNAHGSECEKMTEDLERALGVVGKRTKKREYHEQTRRIDQESRM